MKKNPSESAATLRYKKTKSLVLTGFFFALAIVLSFVESSFPPVFAIAPGVKLGLSNIVVMYALFFIGKGQAFTLAFLKAGFVFITRGSVAALLSLCGGLLSVGIMVILSIIFREKISYLLVSVLGAIFHNMGQYVAICVLYTSLGLWAYLPILLISGVFAGVVTATLLRLTLPAFKIINIK